MFVERRPRGGAPLGVVAANPGGASLREAAFRRSVTIDTSGGQPIRTGAYTVPMPRLTNIDVLSCRASPDATGNLRRPARPGPAAPPGRRACGPTARRHVERGGFSQPPRIVRQQQHRRAEPRSARATSSPRRVQNRMPPMSSGARLDDDAGPRVEQHREAVACERRADAALVVVVADHGEDAVRCVERPQQLRHRRDERLVAEGHVITAEHDEIRRRRPSKTHGALDISRRHERAMVDVGQERDANPVVRRDRGPRSPVRLR